MSGTIGLNRQGMRRTAAASLCTAGLLAASLASAPIASAGNTLICARVITAIQQAPVSQLPPSSVVYRCSVVTTG